MSTANVYLTVAGLGVDVVYKDIKNLHISVYPPVGRVRVAAPHRMTEDTIRLAVVQRLSWIKRQREQLQNADRQTERKMVSGETHYVWGQRYLLDVSKSSGAYGVKTKGNTLWLITPPGTEATGRFGALDRWYRRELKTAVPALLEKWQPILGVEADKFVVRRMKTKWGTCITTSRTIWLNPELAKKDPRCLEYIVVHELAHLRERGHGEKFVALMDQFLPGWRARRDELNEAPLWHEEWEECVRA
ncbi:SprT family zinc-dependent metalloprotease [Rathayibacter festucae]|uniref:M48 family metallopeptidase n=1 Tax=Rathayibacter festucae TaxID=110937 RepID=UPI002A6B6B4C|nr:SprT family zinc-dependent metalloprotease [Rathayibacter festucae]MDY0911318.1 SprT family zinc-dependent metalloprotease [Rathayibacter festucae]